MASTREVFNFLQRVENTEPEVFDVADVGECVSKALEVLKAAEKPVNDRVVATATELLEFFMMKDKHRAFKQMPSLPVLEKKITRSVAPESEEVREFVKTKNAEIEKIVSHAVLDGLYDTDVLFDSECEGCDGFCAVQKAQFTSQFYSSETHCLVPCISQKTKELPPFEYSDFRLVS